MVLMFWEDQTWLWHHNQREREKKKRHRERRFLAIYIVDECGGPGSGWSKPVKM